MDPSSGDISDISTVKTVKAKSCNWRTASSTKPQIHRLHNASLKDNYRQILVEFLDPTPRLDAAQVDLMRFFAASEVPNMCVRACVSSVQVGDTQCHLLVSCFAWRFAKANSHLV